MKSGKIIDLTTWVRPGRSDAEAATAVIEPLLQIIREMEARTAVDVCMAVKMALDRVTRDEDGRQYLCNQDRLANLIGGEYVFEVRGLRRPWETPGVPETDPKTVPKTVQ